MQTQSEQSQVTQHRTQVQEKLNTDANDHDIDDLNNDDKENDDDDSDDNDDDEIGTIDDISPSANILTNQRIFSITIAITVVVGTMLVKSMLVLWNQR